MRSDDPDPSLNTQPRSQPIVVVVDDQPSLCAAVCEVLRERGCIAYRASNAREALALLSRLTPDLILTDIMMPGINGLRLVRWLRSEASFENVPTVVFSAKSSPEDLEEATRSGADAYLPKPFSTEILYEVVGRFIDLG